MGASFTNLQVHVGSHATADAQESVMAAIRSSFDDQGLVELGAAERASGTKADRSVLVRSATDAQWIAVYDEACDENETVLRGLAEQLSAVGGAAVGVLVHDSDILQLCLYEGGQLVDQFETRPDNSMDSLASTGDAASLRRIAVGGHPERWRNLIVGPAGPEDLQTCWDQNSIFAEHVLADVARLLGWDVPLSTVGFTYLDRGVGPFDSKAFARLSFRGIPSIAADLRGTGAPVLVRMPWQPELHMVVGETFGLFGVTFQNTGGTG